MRAICSVHLILLDLITHCYFVKSTSYEVPNFVVSSTLIPPLHPLQSEYSS
jgi:hypothetical protein